MNHGTISIEKIEQNGKLSYNGVVLLTYRIEYPRFGNPYYQSCLAAVNCFYKAKALSFLMRCENVLFIMAVEQYKEALEHNYPLRVFDAVFVCEIAYCDACIISVYYDQYEYTGGAHGSTKRESQTWNLHICNTINLSQLIHCSISPKNYIIRSVKEQIRLEQEIYFDNYADMAAKYFNEKSFYCTPEAVVIYYQQYEIAPYASGIPEFLLPYGGCILEPSATCLNA